MHVAKWTLLRLNPQTVTRFLDYLDDFHPGIQTYYPSYERLSRPAKARRPRLVRRPVFPGYLFARPNLSTGEHIFLVRTPIRARYIRFGPNIELIPDNVILELMRLESLGQLVPDDTPQEPRYHHGQRVFVRLAMTNVPATIIRLIAETRALVETSLCRITVPIHNVEPL
jgi:transcription antitermination factor NusG